MMRALSVAGLLAMTACATPDRPAFEGEQLTIGGQVFSKSDVLSAVPSFDAVGMPVVSITLSPSAQSRFTALTTANVGKQMPIKIGDRILSEPIVTEPIYGNKMQISGNMTFQTAVELAKAISAKGKRLRLR
jgi:preprotein translocase subunit SecD